MFIAYARQDDAGCGWTIGCAQRLWRLQSTTRDEALEELKVKILGEWLSEYGEYEAGYYDDFLLKEVALFEVASEEKIPLDRWYSEAKDRMGEAKRKAHANKVKMEFSRLQDEGEI